MSQARSFWASSGFSATVLALLILPGVAVAQSFTHVHLRSSDPAAAAA